MKNEWEEVTFHIQGTDSWRGGGKEQALGALFESMEMIEILHLWRGEGEGVYVLLFAHTVAENVSDRHSIWLLVRVAFARGPQP